MIMWTERQLQPLAYFKITIFRGLLLGLCFNENKLLYYCERCITINWVYSIIIFDWETGETLVIFKTPLYLMPCHTECCNCLGVWLLSVFCSVQTVRVKNIEFSVHNKPSFPLTSFNNFFRRRSWDGIIAFTESNLILSPLQLCTDNILILCGSSAQVHTKDYF